MSFTLLTRLSSGELLARRAANVTLCRCWDRRFGGSSTARRPVMMIEPRIMGEYNVAQ